MTIKTAEEISQRKVLFDKMSSSHRGTDQKAKRLFPFSLLSYIPLIWQDNRKSGLCSIPYAGIEVMITTTANSLKTRPRLSRLLSYWWTCSFCFYSAHTKQHSRKMSRYIQCMLTTTRCCIFNHRLVLSFAY